MGVRLKEIVALLVNEPWLLRPWEIRRLTMTQIFELYLWPRDDTGKLVFEDPNQTENPDPKDFFFRLWRNRKLRDDQINKKWLAWLEESKGDT